MLQDKKGTSKEAEKQTKRTKALLTLIGMQPGQAEWHQ